jgi:hypothetical protein
VARHLRIRWSVLLRLKKREVEDEIQDEPLSEPSDLISTEDLLRGDGVEVDEDDGGGENRGLRLLSAVPGPLIAAATFVPTFLAIFFGLSYVVGGALRSGSTASAPDPSAATVMSDPAVQGMSAPLAEALLDPFVAPRVFDPPSARPSDPREPPRGLSLADLPTPAIESTRPTLPPAQPRAAISSVPEPRAGRAAEPPRRPQAAVLDTTPERPPGGAARKSGREWTPAAAFADREAASRLASSIQQQGYPVEIRQEQSSARPWVVWIGAQPRGAERRR